MTRLNNIFLFILALSVPFVSTFDKAPFLRYLYFENLYILLAGYFIIYNVVAQKQLSFTKPGRLATHLVIFFLVQIISSLMAADINLAIQKLYIEFQFFVILFVLNSLIIDNASYHSILNGLLIGFVISCTIAVLQYLGYNQFSIYSASELNENAGLITENKENLVRIWGPFGNSLTFSEYLAITGVALYAYFRTIKRKVLLSLLLIATMLFTITLTAGRNALFASIFSFMIIEAVRSKLSLGKILLFSIPVLIVAIVLFYYFSSGIDLKGSQLASRFSNSSKDIKAGRLDLWVKGFEAFKKNIFVGVGWGNLHTALRSEGFPINSSIVYNIDGQHVENYFLTILYTLGIFGFYLCLKIYYFLMKYSYQLYEHGLKLGLAGGVMFGPVIVLIISNITNPALIFDQRIKLLFIFIIVIVNNSYLTFKKTASYQTDDLFVSSPNKKNQPI